MKINRAHAFAAGVVVALLAAAAKFVGGTPLDQTFTYQGQLRNAGQLVNRPVDLRITLWDADVAGGQIGSANTFNAMQLPRALRRCRHGGNQPHHDRQRGDGHSDGVVQPGLHGVLLNTHHGPRPGVLQGSERVRTGLIPNPRMRPVIAPPLAGSRFV